MLMWYVINVIGWFLIGWLIVGRIYSNTEQNNLLGVFFITNRLTLIRNVLIVISLDVCSALNTSGSREKDA